MHTEAVQQSEVHARAELYDWIRLLATLFVVLGHSAYLGNKTTYGMVHYVGLSNICYTPSNKFL